MSDAIADLYITTVRVSNGVPGAPVLTLNLAVEAASGNIPNGKALIVQVTAPPFNEVVVQPVTGTIHHTGLGQDQQLVAVSGVYYDTLPPPAIGTITKTFTAALSVDKAWNGTGSFTFGGTTISNCTVTAL